MRGKSIKVFVIDDSALVREILTKILSEDSELEVIGSAVDPLYAIKKIKEQKPDVITLDLEMPRMDGLIFLEKLMSVYPIPVVVISSLALKGSAATLKALELGAIDFVTKPSLGVGKGLEEIGNEIVQKVKNAANANLEELRRIARRNKIDRQHTPAEDSNPSLEVNQGTRPLVSSTDKVVAIGASTGGTVAVKNILQRLPANMPGIIVVLHMPAGFTAQYAKGLNAYCKINVKEAEDGEPFLNGHAYIAPGGKHLLLTKNTKGYFLKIDNGPPVNRHKPSVDETFMSVAKNASPNSVGVILTGMGSDGAEGLKIMHDYGSRTIAQDEKSSIVFGMPKQAISLGAVDKILPLENIAEAIVGAINGKW